MQDFNPAVQKAVNRFQSLAITQAVIDAAREFSFHGVSVDLIYGLPKQTTADFLNTLDTVIALSPDRLSIFNYAHLPDMFKPQHRINEDDLPSAAEKLDILQQSIRHLSDAGYVYIGMDHFAKPNDPLTIVQQNRRLHRTFQGYSTHAECDLVGFGVSSIGLINQCYSQNVKDLESYCAMIDSKQLPIERGIVFNEEDQLRRHLIADLMCDFAVDYKQFKSHYGIDFKSHFAAELKELEQMQSDGLIRLNQQGFEIQPKGRLMVRNIAMVFDTYLRKMKQQRFSKTL